MRFYSLLPILFFFVTILAKGKTGVIPGEKQCIFLKGMCKLIACTSTEDTIGVCNYEKKCCRKWWIFDPYPTPIPKGKSP
ncbi:PREDICTED: beta-defensin 130-like [Chinchilla lanigera]|uniref:Beta-defensin 130-like n=1 Tax=Chinchilla lanigera TaxID=34839 RepID=A0A8C2VUD2_CHILA|nr:PREDICTED: beta-defensin 130-like [Chinchilla lanigera]